MNKKTIRYEKPLVMDIGITEGVGECVNGTLIINPYCSNGSNPNPGSFCSQGAAALAGCNAGSVPNSCNNGFLATNK